ncbi:MAG: methyltransferase domain-containing protein [Actinobacteria bacterium]|nr:methyltransferase domain-containing protein [Actinomycetota bacterium]
MAYQHVTPVSPADDRVPGETYIYYAREIPCPASASGEFNVPGYSATVWRPAPWRLLPTCLLRPGRPDELLCLWHLFFYWLYHYLFLFSTSREYNILLVFCGGELAHYSVVRSRDFRFPFMAARDLQVGPVWTHPSHRRRGVAGRALAIVCSRLSRAGGRLWWVCMEGNRPSNLVARSQGFAAAGTGYRGKVLGLRLLGSFHIEAAQDVQESAAPAREIPDFTIVTELPGAGATREQFSILYTRYHFASCWVKGKDVIEVACGAGVGLGFLARQAAQVTGGDLDNGNYRLAAETYREHPRVRVRQFDAQSIPFPAASFDVVILFEAIYYLPEARLFLREAHRVLRPEGVLLISSVNKTWRGFSPSPYSQTYYDLRGLAGLLRQNGFDPALYTAFPDAPARPFGALVRTVRRIAVNLHLIPRTMKGKALLKRLFYGSLTPIPRELTEGMAPVEPLIEISGTRDATQYKMIYAVGRKRPPSSL